MSENTALRQSLRLMAHPAALCALGLVLLNDGLFKLFFPSWLTGKLSDLGALVVAPLLLAAVFSLILPPQFPRTRLSDTRKPGTGLPWRDRLTGGLALGSVFALFVLLKLSPVTSTWLLSFARLAGLPLRNVVDPTDLVALPALALPAWLWFGQRPRFSAISNSPSRRWPTGLGQVGVVLISALVLLGDAAAPDYGVTCLQLNEGVIQSQGGYNSHFTSRDGGLTWSLLNGNGSSSCQDKAPGFSLALDGPNGIKYRVTGGQSVERSIKGSAWQSIYQSVALTQAEDFYRQKVHTGAVYFKQGPLDALVDPSSGNLVLAMGQDGVLVVRPGAQPAWMDVLSYHHDDLRQAGAGGLFTLLSLEIWLAVMAAILWLVTVTLRRNFAIWHAILIGFGWLFFTATLLALYPGIANEKEIGAFSGIALLSTLGWTAILLVISLIRQWKPGIIGFLLMALFSPVVGLVFFFPYLMWGFSWLGEYWISAGLAAVLILGMTGVGVWLAPKR